MERLRERVAIARRALGTLQEVLALGPKDTIYRDAAIQRFEYTFEATWKAGQRYLSVVEGLEVGSPRGVIRSLFQVGLLDEGRTRQALDMVDDRNLTTHTYNEALAEEIYSRLAGYADLIGAWLAAMTARL